MALFDKNTWYILKHLHHNIAAQAAVRIENGERLLPMAYLVSPSPSEDAQARMHVAEVAADFISELMHQAAGNKLLLKYLTDALHEGSAIQRQIDREHGIQPSYTICVQEALLPSADSQAAPRSALMVLLNGKNFTLPIFHLIGVRLGVQRICQLRSFPEMQEIEAAQHILQTRMPHDSTLH